MASEHHQQEPTFAPVDFDALNSPSTKHNKVAGATVAALLPFLLNVGEASAKGGELGIWEGRSFALLHPLIMGTLFGLSGYAALLGLEWRELRTMGTAIG